MGSLRALMCLCVAFVLVHAATAYYQLPQLSHYRRNAQKETCWYLCKNCNICKEKHPSTSFCTSLCSRCDNCGGRRGDNICVIQCSRCGECNAEGDTSDMCNMDCEGCGTCKKKQYETA